MNRYLVSMGGTEVGKNRHNALGIHRDYESEVQRLWQSTQNFFHGFFKYDNDWLKSTGYWQDPKTQKVLLEPSFGWAFKGICIQNALSEVNDGDVVMWIDSNHILVGNPMWIIEYARDNNIFCHDHYGTFYPNKDWTHRDTFVRMGCDNADYWTAPQIQVNVMAFCKNKFVIDFVKEWVNYCLDYDTNICGNQKLPDFPGWKENRNEQSIFSILVEKYHIKYQPDPYQTVYELDGMNKNE